MNMFVLQGFVVCVGMTIVISSSLKSPNSAKHDASMYDELKRLLTKKDDLWIPAPTPRELDKRNNIGTEVTLTSAMKDSILSLHNEARANAEPVPETSLTDLTWNEQLANTAKDWGLGCTWQHNSARSNGYNGYVGENLGITKGYTSSDSVTASINGWVDEKNYYDYETNTCPENKMCGHYTQVVWAGTTEVGCALVDCPNMTNLGSYWNGAKLLVCNYLPGGNACMSTPRPYEVGCPAK